MIDYASLGQTEVLLDLIDNHGFNVNLADKNGYTALMSAAKRGQTNTALGLISRGADKNMKDKLKHMTADQWAEASGHSETAFTIISFDKSMLPEPSGPKALTRTTLQPRI